MRLAGARSDMQKGRSFRASSKTCAISGRVRIRRSPRSACGRRASWTGSREHPLLTDALAALDRAVIEAGEAEEKLETAAQALVHDPAALDDAETPVRIARNLPANIAAKSMRCPT